MRRYGKRVLQVLLGVLGLGIGIVAVLALREATLSTHQTIAPDSRIELVVDTHVSGAESAHDIEQFALAQITTCQLEVSSNMVGELEPLGDGEFRAVLNPSMDETNRKQFRGCLEDFIIDHVQLDVLTLAEIG